MLQRLIQRGLDAWVRGVVLVFAVVYGVSVCDQMEALERHLECCPCPEVARGR